MTNDDVRPSLAASRAAFALAGIAAGESTIANAAKTLDRLAETMRPAAGVRYEPADFARVLEALRRE